jgi:hypothetical protein
MLTDAVIKAMCDEADVWVGPTVVHELATRLLSAEARVRELEAGAKASKEDAAFKIIALFREY